MSKGESSVSGYVQLLTVNGPVLYGAFLENSSAVINKCH